MRYRFKQLNASELSDALDLSAIEQLAEPLNRRARHVFHENNRVLQIRKGVSAIEFGQLMNESHLSLKTITKFLFQRLISWFHYYNKIMTYLAPN